MKKSPRIRLLSLALALVLCLSMVPQQAQALDLSSFDAFKRQATAVSGTWSDTKFWRSNRYTYPFEFNNDLNSCTGFTLYYEIVSVEKGSLSGNFVFEVYVRTTSGTWKSVETFYLDGDEATVDVRFDDPMSIDAVAVICQKKATFSYTHDMTVYNATYKSTGSNKNNNSNNNSTNNNTYSTGSAVKGQWADSVFRRSNRTTYPFEFYSPLNRCKSFTLNYEITEITQGSLSGNFKYCVYVRTTGGEWKYVHEFTMSGYSTSTKVYLDGPMSIDAVAVFCLKNSNMSYSYTFTITNPVTK